MSDHQENDLISVPVIENPEHQTMWYSKYFLGKFHHNYVGQDSEKSPYVLSVVEEKSFGKLISMLMNSLLLRQAKTAPQIDSLSLFSSNQ